MPWALLIPFSSTCPLTPGSLFLGRCQERRGVYIAPILPQPLPALCGASPLLTAAQQSPDKTASHSPLFSKCSPFSAQEQNREVTPSIPSDKCGRTLGTSLFSSNNAGVQTQGLSHVRQVPYHCTTHSALDFCFQMSCLSLPFVNKPTFCMML